MNIVTSENEQGLDDPVATVESQIGQAFEDTRQVADTMLQEIVP